MKKIFSLLILTIILISSVFAQGNGAGNTIAPEDSDDILESDVDEAKAQGSVSLCVRYLKNKYPRQDVRRLNNICGQIEKNKEAIARTIRKQVRDNFPNVDQLTDEQKAKIKAMGRSKVAKLAVEKPEVLKQKLQNYNIKKFTNKADMFRKRTVDNYKEARERYEWLKDKHKEIKDELADEKAAFKDAVELGDDEAQINAAKDYLTSVADLVLNSLETVRAKVEENDDLTEEEAIEILTKIDENIELIQDAKEEVDVATTKEEVKEAGAVIVKNWNKMKEKVRFYSGQLIKSKVHDVTSRAEFLENKFERALNKLEELGYDVSIADELLDEYSESLETAKEYFKDAKDKFEEAKELINSDEYNREDAKALVEDGKELLKLAHESLKDAHETSKEIIKEIRETGYDKVEELLEDEEEDYYVVEEEDEEDSEDESNEDIEDNDDEEDEENNEENNEEEYNSESWNTIIPDSCVNFFDGCNTCFKIEGSDQAGCTKMACAKYDEPKCLDDDKNDEEICTEDSDCSEGEICINSECEENEEETTE